MKGVGMADMLCCRGSYAMLHLAGMKPGMLLCKVHMLVCPYGMLDAGMLDAVGNRLSGALDA